MRDEQTPKDVCGEAILPHDFQWNFCFYTQQHKPEVFADTIEAHEAVSSSLLYQCYWELNGGR